MSKVKIEGHGTGTGTFTVTTPSSNTDRTITLPDATGTLATTADTGVAGITSAADATAINILSNERVGINKTTPDARLDISAASETALRAVATVSGEYAAVIQSASTNTTPILSLRKSGGTETVRFSSEGGILFNGDSAASNALDDYEEGIHQTTFAAGNGQSITTGRNDLGYTKIGNLVSITGEITCNAASSPTGGTTITLPFVIATNAGDREFNFGSAPLCYHVNEYEDRMPMILGGSGASTVTLLYQRHDASFYDFNVAASDTFFFSFSYKTN